MLYEAGFEFQNFVPVWFRAHAAKVLPGVVRSLVVKVQRLHTAELTAWLLITDGATFKVRPALDVQARSEPQPVLDYHPEDEYRDLILSDFNLLRRTYVLRLRKAGLRSIRSPTGSSIWEQEQRVLQTNSASLRAVSSPWPEQPRGTSDPVPSLVGTSDESSYGVMLSSYTSESYCSGSSGSPTLGHSAASHMPSAGFGQLVMPAQASGTDMFGGELGFYVTRETFEHPALPDPQDVTMTAATSDAIGLGLKQCWSWSTTELSQVFVQTLFAETFSVTKVQSVSRVVPIGEVQANWITHLVQSSGSFGANTTSDAAAVTHLDEKVSAASKSGISTAQPQLDSLSLGEGRGTKGLSPIAGPLRNLTRQTQREVEAGVQAAAHQAAQAERARTDATIAQRVQQQQVDAKRRHKLSKQSGSLRHVRVLKNLSESEAARKEDQRTAKNIQEFHVGLLRDLRATSAKVHVGVPTVDPKPVTAKPSGNDYPQVTTTQRGVGEGVEVRPEPGLKNVPGVVLDQLRATLPAADSPEYQKREAVPVEEKVVQETDEIIAEEVSTWRRPVQLKWELKFRIKQRSFNRQL
ncbi:hypothetical protein PHMEG_00012094 [Phytophthora megakarya]|uniref:Uncharacterized protein n=1 Tax=Phytophthora megakarya TaxID=4795 RepID=A0A225WC69_9STRA|nr:hypothetical protein PHMEG_00012094 [Phytophthora megakarya]